MSIATTLLEAVEPPPSSEVVVAVSGGADSAFLAWAMQQIANPRLVHIDHGTPASSALAKAAQDLADHLGMDLQTVSVVVPSGPSWEAQARSVRRSALEAVAGSAVIVTGHHHDDQVETVLGNLMRGAGATGLSGMLAFGGRWYRPLLGLTRADIRKAIAELGLPFAEDPTNDDLAMRRNRIRHDLLPTLEQASSGIGQRLARTGVLLADDDAALNAAASKMSLRTTAHGVEMAAGELCVVPSAVAARTIRRALRTLDGTYPGSADDVSAVLSVARGSMPRASLSGDLIVSCEQGVVAITPIARVSTQWAATRLAVPGVAKVGRWKITSLVDDGSTPTGRRRARLSLPDADPLVVRPAAEGDRIDIGGGSKLVSDAMREANVPVSERSSWPVVVADARIVWIAGVRVAAWATARPGSGAVLFEMGAI